MTCSLPHLYFGPVGGEWGGDGVCERIFGKDKGWGLWSEGVTLSQRRGEFTTGKQVQVGARILEVDL